jgi:hypothetical protein
MHYQYETHVEHCEKVSFNVQRSKVDNFGSLIDTTENKSICHSDVRQIVKAFGYNI